MIKSLEFLFSFFWIYRNDIISKTREFRREFDVIKQRATRVCNLVKTLIDVIDFCYEVFRE